MSDTCLVDNIEVRFERRRYGRQTYTWAEALINGEWISLGDPWPGINWKLAELKREIGAAVARSSNPK